MQPRRPDSNGRKGPATPTRIRSYGSGVALWKTWDAVVDPDLAAPDGCRQIWGAISKLAQHIVVVKPKREKSEDSQRFSAGK